MTPTCELGRVRAIPLRRDDDLFGAQYNLDAYSLYCRAVLQQTCRREQLIALGSKGRLELLVILLSRL